jgi:hypothetical protein
MKRICKSKRMKCTENMVKKSERSIHFNNLGTWTTIFQKGLKVTGYNECKLDSSG